MAACVCTRAKQCALLVAQWPASTSNVAIYYSIISKNSEDAQHDNGLPVPFDGAGRVSAPAHHQIAYTVASLAEAWQCSEGVIRKLVASGALGCFRLGTLIRIPAEEVARFQNTQSSASRGDTQSSGETTKASAIATALPRPTALELKLKHGGFGCRDTVRTGPWAGS